MKLLLFIFSFSFLFPDSCNVQIAGHLTFGQGLSDITGFAQDDKEFAVVGLIQDVAVFVDVTDPFNPKEIKRINGNPSVWRDIKYWNRYVYIGTEADDGIKVISVDDPQNPILVYTITDFGPSHNIHIDKDGYLYVVGALGHNIWIYNLAIPELPELVGTWDGEYLHDIEVYNNKIYGAGIYTGYFYIIDVVDKTKPFTILSHYTGLDGVSTHDCAITADEKYLLTGDETYGGHLKIWDISNYNNINLISEYMTSNEHSLHNLYIRPETNLVIMSYYVDGTRILDISDPFNPIEVGYYDTTENTSLYDGNWGTYAYLPSGFILSSDRQNGLFVLSSPLTNSDIYWSDCDPENNNWYGEYNTFELSIIEDLVKLNPNLENYEYKDFIEFNAGDVISIDLSDLALYSLKLPENFGSLSNLKSLNISNNYLTLLPSLICNLPEDCSIDISKNQLCADSIELYGDCIDKIGYQLCGECESGYWLDGYCIIKTDTDILKDLIDLNRPLSGMHPLELGIVLPGQSNWNNGSLVRLDVSDHEIEKLPENIGSLENIVELDFKNNSISNLPDSFSNLNSLKILKLHNNLINQLPNDFGNLILLEELYLSGNLLTTLPLDIGELKSLKKLHLQNNFLIDLPSSFCDLSDECIKKLGNNCLSGFFNCDLSLGSQRTCDSLGVDEKNLPSFELFDPLPNPFNSSVRISFLLNQPGTVNIEVFDLNGKLIDTIMNQWFNTGYAIIDWPAGNLSSGIYLAKIRINDNLKIKSMILLK